MAVNALPPDVSTRRPPDACDHVGVRHDQAACRDPPRALDTEAARNARHPHDARGRTNDVRILREALVGRSDDRGRAEEDTNGVDPLELLQQALGREDVVDLREDRRALHGATQVGLAREVEEDGTDRPAQEHSGDETEHQPGEAVEQAHPGYHADARVEGSSQQRGETAHEHAEEHRRAERDDRDVRRTVTQDLRREPRAEVGTDRESRKGERPT